MDTLKKALEAIAHLPHDEECATQMATSRGQPDANTACTCHVGIAEQALEAWVQKPQPAERVVDRCAYFLFPKLRAVAKRWPAHPDHPAEKALAREVVEETLLNLAGNAHAVVRVDRDIVDHYRKADADVRSDQKWTCGLPAAHAVMARENIDARQAVAIDLADAVLAAIDEGGAKR